ncbi:MAG: metallophosphoesterase [Luteolibacter sp.]
MKLPIAAMPPLKPSGLNRRNALRLLSAGLAGSLVDAFWIEPKQLSVTRQAIRCESLPPALDGLRIGLLADFHYRPDDDQELLEKVIASVRDERLDLIALPGDFMSGDPTVIQPMLDQLGKMKATHGIFAVMGNHDGWNGNPVTIRRQFERAGISFLINQHSLLSIRNESLAIAGTDFIWKGKPEPEKTLKGISAKTPVIALVHEPDYFETMTAHREILLQLSGHTHGGQCRVPLVGYAPRTVEYGRNFNYGTYSSGNSKLFVTRGVGTSGPRVRFACPPELAILTLRTQGPQMDQTTSRRTNC